MFKAIYHPEGGNIKRCDNKRKAPYFFDLLCFRQVENIKVEHVILI